MRAPLSDHDGEDHIRHERHQGDEGKDRRVEIGQPARHQKDLHNRWHHAVEREVHERSNAPRAPLDVSGKATGLPLEVKAHREVVEMLKDLERNISHGTLGDAGKDDLTQLRQERG